MRTVSPPPLSLATLFVIALASTAAGISGGAAATTVDTLTEIDAGSGGIALDAEGNIYSADFGAVLGDPTTAGTKVFKITPDGKAKIFAEGFEGASGNAFDSQGNLFQSNIRGGYISRITPDGGVSKFTSEGLRGPVGIAIDSDDTLFVNNCGGNSIQKITRDGTSAQFVVSPLFKCPNGITFGDAGNLYVANFYNGDVVKVTPEGEITRLVTLPGNNNGHLTYSDDSLYVVARSAHQVFKVSLDGKFTVFAGSGKKGGGRWRRPRGQLLLPQRHRG